MYTIHNINALDSECTTGTRSTHMSTIRLAKYGGEIIPFIFRFTVLIGHLYQRSPLCPAFYYQIELLRSYQNSAITTAYNHFNTSTITRQTTPHSSFSGTLASSRKLTANSTLIHQHLLASRTLFLDMASYTHAILYPTFDKFAIADFHSSLHTK